MFVCSCLLRVFARFGIKGSGRGGAAPSVAVLASAVPMYLDLAVAGAIALVDSPTDHLGFLHWQQGSRMPAPQPSE